MQHLDATLIYRPSERINDLNHYGDLVLDVPAILTLAEHRIYILIVSLQVGLDSVKERPAVPEGLVAAFSHANPSIATLPCIFHFPALRVAILENWDDFA